MMSRTTGQPITRVEHLRQSIGDILTTPIGSRVMRREYGSLIPELIDQPLNGATTVRLYAAAAAAIMRWEPRLRVSRVQLILGDRPGAATLEISGTDAGTGERFAVAVPVRMGAAA